MTGSQARKPFKGLTGAGFHKMSDAHKAEVILVERVSRAPVSELWRPAVAEGDSLTRRSSPRLGEGFPPTEQPATGSSALLTLSGLNGWDFTGFFVQLVVVSPKECP